MMDFEIKNIDKKVGLNLGCGRDIYKSTEDIDWINVDIAQLEGVDIVWDLNTIPYLFIDKLFDVIIMNDILEHLNEPPMVIKECYRLLKKGGELKIKVVYFSHRYAWGDPQHKHAFSEIFFEFFCKKTRRRDYYYDFAFEDIKNKFIYDGDKIQGIEVVLTK